MKWNMCMEKCNEVNAFEGDLWSFLFRVCSGSAMKVPMEARRLKIATCLRH